MAVAEDARQEVTMTTVPRLILFPVGVYVSWLGMMTTHEAGHALHARLSGGAVERVSIPLFGFSQTFYTSNPGPQFVAWGGPVWGCVIPILLIAIAAPIAEWFRRWTQFFAGFCLLANGLYLGVGWTTRTGDAGELLKRGAPVWALIAFGAVASVAGLYLWHRLGAEKPDAGA
jgi:hypothetical protein